MNRMLLGYSPDFDIFEDTKGTALAPNRASRKAVVFDTETTGQAAELLNAAGRPGFGATLGRLVRATGRRRDRRRCRDRARRAAAVRSPAGDACRERTHQPRCQLGFDAHGPVLRHRTGRPQPGGPGVRGGPALRPAREGSCTPGIGGPIQLHACRCRAMGRHARSPPLLASRASFSSMAAPALSPWPGSCSFSLAELARASDMPTASAPIRIGYCLSLTGPVAGNSRSAQLAHEM